MGRNTGCKNTPIDADLDVPVFKLEKTETQSIVVRMKKQKANTNYETITQSTSQSKGDLSHIALNKDTNTLVTLLMKFKVIMKMII